MSERTGPLEPVVYVVEDLAVLLKVSAWKVRQLIHEGEIPGAFRLGNRLAVSQDKFHEKFGHAVEKSKRAL